jgi:hypothetical protein
MLANVPLASGTRTELNDANHDKIIHKLLRAMLLSPECGMRHPHVGHPRSQFRGQAFHQFLISEM